ncbi:MAG: PQQ-binding-like beta-propeller repeat protein [Planctomycetaceae bacterium]
MGGPTDQNIKWKVPLPGPAPSSPIVVETNLITCAIELEGAEEQGEFSQVRHHLLCFDRRTGDQLWERTIDKGSLDAGTFTVKGLPAASTPASDGLFVYTFFGLAGIDAHTLEGEKVWHTGLGKTTDSTLGWRGASPVVHNNRVYINALNEARMVVCLSAGWTGAPLEMDTSRGSQVREFHEYSGCVRFTREFLSDLVGGGWQRIDVFTGRSDEIQSEASGIPIATPSKNFRHDPTAGTSKKSLTAYRIANSSQDTPSTLDFEKCGSYTVTPLVMNNHVYGVSHSRILWSLSADDIRSSNTLAQPHNERGPFKGKIFASLVAADPYLYLVTENEGAFVYRPGDHGFGEPVAKNLIVGDDSSFCGTPAISGDELFLRSNRFLYCIAEQ